MYVGARKHIGGFQLKREYQSDRVNILEAIECKRDTNSEPLENR